MLCFMLINKNMTICNIVDVVVYNIHFPIGTHNVLSYHTEHATSCLFSIFKFSSCLRTKLYAYLFQYQIIYDSTNLRLSFRTYCG
uniref:CSON011758 protein n=1 Tax=Culicoides sonorensis TaxID=179676 RepID=A0A336MFW1_CULSO